MTIYSQATARTTSPTSRKTLSGTSKTQPWSRNLLLGFLGPENNKDMKICTTSPDMLTSPRCPADKTLLTALIGWRLPPAAFSQFHVGVDFLHVCCAQCSGAVWGRDGQSSPPPWQKLFINIFCVGHTGKFLCSLFLFFFWRGWGGWFLHCCSCLSLTLDFREAATPFTVWIFRKQHF